MRPRMVRVRERGETWLVVGRDVSVIGVDNHRVFAEALEPQLTTVELPHYEMGYWATRNWYR